MNRSVAASRTKRSVGTDLGKFVSFEQEWAELRAAAAARGAMQINSVPAEGGGGNSGDLVVNRDDLGAIGNDAYDLRVKVSREGDHARPATFDAAIALTNGNFTSGSAVLKVHDRWNTHLKTLLDSLAHISNHLDYTKAQHAKDDVKIEGDLAPISKLTEYMN
ncbi:hypothetical protein B046DRAFT_01636 [Streptomyces sp. LamerLS-316]|nr:hypothetical protein B046DRAFT_01636 [Streptomyces sp. LamerLS-316]